jgi:hypothetical protein
VRQSRWNNQSMAIQRAPQKIAGDGRHFGPGTLRRPSDTVGAAEQVPPIKPAAQTTRASQISRNPAESTSALAVDRGAAYPGQPVNYGTT